MSAGIVSRCDAPDMSAGGYLIDCFVEAVAAAPLFHFDAARVRPEWVDRVADARRGSTPAFNTTQPA